MIALQSLASEFAITVSDGAVWLAIAQGLLFGAVCLAFGIWVARTVGLLETDAPAGETLGVGLAAGLMVLAAWWAAIWSGGRSSFTPVAVGFAIAIVLALVRRVRHPVDAEDPAPTDTTEAATNRWSDNRPIVLAALAGGVFVVAIALLYGSTMAPSPRDGVQPVENRDEAFYAVLGRDLATTGNENNTLPSGFSDLPGSPAQTWYHWGELWLASMAITIFGAAPLAARFFIVLPVLLLAAGALTGTLVRRITGMDSWRVYVFGFVACLLLAPVPLIPGPFFSSWAVGMVFGITLYGLGAIAGLLALYGLVVLGRRAGTWALAAFVGSVVAFILPAHFAIAVLALVGVGIVCGIGVIRTVVARRLQVVAPVWVRSVIATGVAIVSTLVWGMATGHSLGGGSSTSTVSSGGSALTSVDPATVISAFNASWRESVAITILGAGVFLAIPVAWYLRRKVAPFQSDLYLATLGVLAAGAIGWGWRLGDFTMFYLYFAGIAVFATPIAVAAVLTVWERVRTAQHRRLAIAVIVLCAIQLELGATSVIVRLQGFGPGDEAPISVNVLDAIERLPADAKLAYSCGPFDEIAVGTPQLLSIDAHTSRRVVPMCFEAEFPNTVIGAERSDQVVSQFFRGSPQSLLYPNAEARPSSAAVTEFLKIHGIDYIYVSAKHPTLLEGAIPFASGGGGMLQRVP